MSILDRLCSEHDELRSRVVELRTVGEELRSGIGTYTLLRLQESAAFLRDRLAAHEQVEEQVLLPSVRTEMPELVSALAAEHHELTQWAAEIGRLAWQRQLGVTSSETMRTALEWLCALLPEHLNREETQLFGAAAILPKETLTETDAEADQGRTAGAPSLSLVETNGRLHLRLDDLLLDHLETLTALDGAAARRTWTRFRSALETHSAVEDDIIIPFYESLGGLPKGGKPEFFTAEHEGLVRLVVLIEARLDSLLQDNVPLRRRVVSSLERYTQFRILLEHHTLREQNIMYPTIAARTDPTTQTAFRDALESAWRKSAGSGESSTDEEVKFMSDQQQVDVRQVPPPQRHPLIFGTFEALQLGDAFVLVNDHDPKPLYYQFAAERQGQFTWEYQEQGPQTWRVRIGKTA